MVVSRREFLQRGTLLTAGVALPFQQFHDLGRGTNDGGHPGSPGAGGITRSGNLLNMTAQSFAPYVNSGFNVQVAGQSIAMILLSAADLPQPAPPSNLASYAVMPPAAYFAPSPVTSFALTFSGPSEIAQGSYQFQHPGLGQFSLFIVPGLVGTYNAVVSHISSKSVNPILPPGGGRGNPPARSPQGPVSAPSAPAFGPAPRPGDTGPARGGGSRQRSDD
jgi:hypothetical protein